MICPRCGMSYTGARCPRCGADAPGGGDPLGERRQQLSSQPAGNPQTLSAAPRQQAASGQMVGLVPALVVCAIAAAVIVLIVFSPQIKGVLARGSQTSSAVETASAASQQDQAAYEPTDIKQKLVAFGEFDPQVTTGAGDKTIGVPNNGYPVLIKCDFSGTGNFIVRGLNGDGDQADLFVNAIGDYSGTVVDYENSDEVTQLQVQADGNWTISCLPMSYMDEAKEGETHHGDDVVYLDADDVSRLTFTNSGDGNFIVWAIGWDDAELLVNALGAGDHTVAWTDPQAILVVTSDGDWTVSRSDDATSDASTDGAAGAASASKGAASNDAAGGAPVNRRTSGEAA